MASLEQRIAKLEDKAGGATTQRRIILLREGDDKDAAIAKDRAKNGDGAEYMVVQLVAPRHGSPASMLAVN